jgi:phytoene desaturase
MSRKPIVIIGAGIGGLSAAIRLAIAGEAVLILEQHDQVGGKMGEFQAAGYRWDTGPSVITMRHVFEDLFTAAGRKLDDYLTLLPVDPLTRYFYPDGQRLDVTRELPPLLEQIARFDPRDVEGYLRYLAYAATLHRITGPVFIYDQPPHLASFTKVAPLDALKIDPLRTMQQAIEGFVHSPHMRQLLGRFATYVGASPYQAPATLNVIAHVELNGGVWYPQGGIYQIAHAMAALARELGVEIHTATTVESINLDQDQVHGVTVRDGTTIEAQAVIANVDVATVYERMLPSVPERHQQLERLTKIEPSVSGFIMLLGINKAFPQLAHHNIFFSRDYRQEFEQIFRDGVPPNDPTIYITATSKTDPSHAPSGCENWFVLVNAPPLGSSYDWNTHTQTYGEQVMQKLAEHGLDVRGHIQHQHLLTPLDIERLTGARRGALYGSSSNNRFAAFLRPHNRARDVKGLYFAGGTTHPGGGVPMVTLSGKVAADLLLADLQRNSR